MKYYVNILGIWVRVPKTIFYNCNLLWRKMEEKYESNRY